jgi:hypothetical protein
MDNGERGKRDKGYYGEGQKTLAGHITQEPLEKIEPSQSDMFNLSSLKPV